MRCVATRPSNARTLVLASRTRCLTPVIRAQQQQPNSVKHAAAVAATAAILSFSIQGRLMLSLWKDTACVVSRVPYPHALTPATGTGKSVMVYAVYSSGG